MIAHFRCLVLTFLPVPVGVDKGREIKAKTQALQSPLGLSSLQAPI